MAGDDLAILLFFLTCAVAFGIEAVKAETVVRRVSFAVIALGCLGGGAFWLQIKKTLWPVAIDKITLLATNPVSWFVILIFLLAVLAFHRPHERKPRENTALVINPVSGIASTASFTITTPAKEAPEEEEAKEEEPRQFVDTTPTYLLSITNDETRTRVQSQRIIEPYVGKWLKVSGTVNDIFPHSVFMLSDSYKGNRQYDLLLSPAPDWIERFHLLEANRKITVIGKIRGVSFGEVELEKCELVA